MDANLDILLENIRVIDGSGRGAFKSDVGVKGDKITYVGCSEKLEAKTRISGEGLSLAPGFIDVHAHYDNVIFYDPVNFCKLSQGVTTEISGNCGISMAPVSIHPPHRTLWKTFLERATGSKMPDNIEEYTSYDKYFKDVEKLSIAINVAYLVGQGAVRTAVMGFENRPATSAELDHMKGLVRDAMSCGALGLSTGLIFPPGIFTPQYELVALCRVVREYGGVYTTHMRNEAQYVMDSLKESIELAKQADIPVQISHFKINGKPNWGLSSKALELIEKAIQEGVNISVDMYPYTAGSTPLNFAIPPRYSEEGTAKMIEILSDKRNWPAIEEEMLNPKDGWDSYLLNCGYEGIIIMSAPATPDAVGKTILQYAKDKGIKPIEAIFDIMVKNEGQGVAAWFMIGEEDLQNIMKSPYTMFGTDGVPVPEGATTHPRIIGSFPRVLGQYVREKGVLHLEEAVSRMTSLPAKKFGLKTKGLIREGGDADLILFDADKIRDRADFSNCFAQNQGIKLVVVNGQIVISENSFIGNYAGRLLRI